MAADVSQLDRLEKVGVGLIKVQLELANTDPRNAVHDIWALGYCFGIFDAIVQRAKLDQYTEGAALLTIGFGLLLSDIDEGASRFGYAMDRQTHPVFVAGNKRAGGEVFDWFANTDRVPMALRTHFSPTM